MFCIHFRLIMFVAAQTGEFREGRRVRMTGRAVVPRAVVLTREDGKQDIVVGHESRLPAIHFVATLAIS